MKRFRIPATFLLTLLAAGCSTDAHRPGNPFDEPLAREPLQAYPQQHRVTQKVAGLERIPAPSEEQAQPQEPEVQVFPAGAQPTPIATTPEIRVADTPTPDTGREALDEAERVGSTGDTGSMIELLEQSAFRGNMDALYKLAKVYQNGEGVPANPEIAVAYLTTASGLGHAESTRVLAWDYLLGKGVSKDIPYGTGLMEKASTSSVRAKREFALLLNNTYQPGLNDPSRGLALLKEAAATGDADSVKALNLALNKSSAAVAASSKSPVIDKVVSPVHQAADSTESRAETLKQRAMSGDVEAMYKLGLSYSLGKAPAIDPQFEAYCWFSVAANHGHSKAQTEVTALAGVRTMSDRKNPGKLDQCIREMGEVVDQG